MKTPEELAAEAYADSEWADTEAHRRMFVEERQEAIESFLAGIAWRDANPKAQPIIKEFGFIDEAGKRHATNRITMSNGTIDVIDDGGALIRGIELSPETKKVLADLEEERRKDRLRDAEELPLKALKPTTI